MLYLVKELSLFWNSQCRLSGGRYLFSHVCQLGIMFEKQTKHKLNKLLRKYTSWKGKEGRGKDLRLIRVQTVHVCEHFPRMFRIQILSIDGTEIA